MASLCIRAIYNWLLQPFRLLDSVKARLQLVIFCGVFGCLFLNVFRPFNISHWFQGVETPLFFILTFFSAAGMAALALTQFAVRSLFKVQLTTRIGFLAWLLLEFFIISVAVHIVNFMITHHPIGDFNEYLQTLKYTLLVLILPYFMAILFLYIEEQLLVVKELSLKVNLTVNKESITITDESGKVVLSLSSKNILYFKSEDNYILLYYKVDNKLSKELIRTNLKKLEKELNQPNFIRIHRSYMINSQNLLSAAKTPRGYQVKMDTSLDVTLPVSITYQREFEDRLIQKG